MYFVFATGDLAYLRSVELLKNYGANINHVAVTQLSDDGKLLKPAHACARSLVSVVRDQALRQLKTTESTTHISTR